MVQLADKVPETRAPTGRIEALDMARGVALFAMATYHFAWDLEFFGYIPAGSTGDGWLKIYARLIAGSFLFLAGVSLALAHGNGLRPRAFAKRLGVIVIAAAAISIATYFATPDSFIFFGILHAIALSSVIGLVFLPLPWVMAVLAGIVCVSLPQFYRDDFFNSTWLYWIGLHTVPPRSNDFVPLAPWLGPFLIGLGLTQLAVKVGMVGRAAALDTGHRALSRAVRFCGRHSLAVYLLHQPILLVLVWTYSQIQPAAPADPVSAFVADCRAGCEATSESGFCERFCVCVTDDLLSQGLFSGFANGSITIESDDRIPAIAEQCTVEAQP
ncbi:heparan-alpha-glucosaminide N-acetyltransferase [Hoeflea sp.]|uniref:heparan-alpha-glucosaminide N-acetyltransferase n=1 Tax=Hoeflea sp. TaxID=1940281 RepID=UPI003B51B8BA